MGLWIHGHRSAGDTWDLSCLCAVPSSSTPLVIDGYAPRTHHQHHTTVLAQVWGVIYEAKFTPAVPHPLAGYSYIGTAIAAGIKYDFLIMLTPETTAQTIAECTFFLVDVNPPHIVRTPLAHR